MAKKFKMLEYIHRDKSDYLKIHSKNFFIDFILIEIITHTTKYYLDALYYLVDDKNLILKTRMKNLQKKIKLNLLFKNNLNE